MNSSYTKHALGRVNPKSNERTLRASPLAGYNAKTLIITTPRNLLWFELPQGGEADTISHY